MSFSAIVAAARQKTDLSSVGADYSEYLLCSLLKIVLIVFGFFIYIVGPVPWLTLLRDVLPIMVASATLVDFVQRRSSSHVNEIDLLVSALFLYLIGELIYTAVRIDSLAVAYLGFRLDFMPIVLYFGFRRLDREVYRREVQRVFLAVMIAGALLTLIELGLVLSGLVDPLFLYDLLNYTEHRRGITLGGVPRVIGIGITPHITGVHHLILLGVLLLWSRRSNKEPSVPLRILQSGHRATALTLLASATVILSTSKTAWVILPVVIILSVLSQGRLNWRTVLTIATVPLVLYPIVMIEKEQFLAMAEAEKAGFYDVYSDWVVDFTEDVLRDSPFYGYGFEYDDRFLTSYQAPKLTMENQPINSDIYFAEVLRMLGGFGLAMFALLLVVIPFLLLFSRHYSLQGKGAALGVLAVGLAFIHYSPLASPSTNSAMWYLIALMAHEWSSSWDRVRAPALDAGS